MAIEHPGTTGSSRISSHLPSDHPARPKEELRCFGVDVVGLASAGTMPGQPRSTAGENSPVIKGGIEQKSSVYRWCFHVSIQTPSFLIYNWLVVSTLPLWKIWVRQLEGWHPIYEMENKTCSKPPTSYGFPIAMPESRSPWLGGPGLESGRGKRCFCSSAWMDMDLWQLNGAPYGGTRHDWGDGVRIR